MLQDGDAVLVKGSRSVGLELVTDELLARRGAAASPAGGKPTATDDPAKPDEEASGPGDGEARS
jgi:hypothetical protein